MSESKNSKTLFSARDLAERWSLSPSSIYHRGESLQGLTPVYIGRSVRFHQEDVERVERELLARARRQQKRLNR
jgi:predicted DNA-binding transcriptional regulator AlpA